MTMGGKSEFKVSVVIPALNEEGNIDSLVEALVPWVNAYPKAEIIFVDDGSTDGTLNRLRELEALDKRVQWISLSRNFGHQNALKAGLDHASGDCVISMDCDLQHPPELIPEMIQHWLNGYDVVFTVREDDPSLPLVKRLTTKLFYSVVQLICDVSIPFGAADFRLLDRRVVAIVRDLPENFLFLRGLIPWLGFRQIGIRYSPKQRRWGETKYSVKRMIRFALDGIVSFSIKPLRLSAFLGSVTSGFAFLYAVYAIVMKAFTNRAIEGWASVLVSVLFLSGIQLIVLGVIGEYVGRTFLQCKQRPNYVIKEKSRDL